MLQKLVLQNFRNYSQQLFEFTSDLTIIIGQNTAGKTNFAEAIMLLATGKSFRAEKDTDMIRFGEDVGRVQGLVSHQVSDIQTEKQKTEQLLSDHRQPRTDNRNIKLEVVIAQGQATGGRISKRYFVNDVTRSRAAFIGHLPVVLFRPEELDIIVDGPSMRRDFLNDVLESIDPQYVVAKQLYDKALRQRNALLDVVKETGIRNKEQFMYWDELLITNGNYITAKREACIAFFNEQQKDIMECTIHYDKSIISAERLAQYADAEIGAGNTLVGPQRDDFFITMHTQDGKERNAHQFGSRGQQRLVILQLKLLHMLYVESVLQQKPLLLLDDIFSELDSQHIQLVLDKVSGSQVILTTTHKEFIKDVDKKATMLELEE